MGFILLWCRRRDGDEGWELCGEGKECGDGDETAGR